MTVARKKNPANSASAKLFLIFSRPEDGQKYKYRREISFDKRPVSRNKTRGQRTINPTQGKISINPAVLRRSLGNGVTRPRKSHSLSNFFLYFSRK